MGSIVDRRSFAAKVALATATLLGLIASHAVRETARDTLFLTGLPATRLPWAYLGMAAAGVGLGLVNRLLLDRLSHRWLLIGTLGVAVAIDAVFWTIASQPTAAALFCLYAWTGMLGTAVTLQLWLHLADVFDVAEAKRAFPRIAAGGLLGAVLGSLLSGALLRVIATQHLLLASAALLLISACVALALPSRGETTSTTSSAPAPTQPQAASRSEIPGSRYLVQITVLSVAASMLGTGIDFVFKQSVVEAVPPARLGTFFADFNAAVNSAALCTELVLASWLLRHIGVTRTLSLLPIAMLASGGAFAAFGGLTAAVVLKALDGTLRPSLHLASTEVLYQPLSAQARNAVKTAAESVGKRGGQALASLALLGATAAALEPRQIGIGFVALAVLALCALIGLRREYVARFRERLRGLAEEARTQTPRLELDSLETLVANLSSPDDTEVLAAIDLLEHYRRAALLPPLLLHHPSGRVVERALEILKSGDHPHLDPLLERLLEHPAAEIRSAALNALIARGSESAPLERLLHTDPSPRVRTTAVVALTARHGRPDQAAAFLADLIAKSSAEERLAVAGALPALTYAVASEVAVQLIDHREDAGAKALAQALSNEPSLDPDWIPALVALLARRQARPAARAALLRMGDRALEALDAALRDPATDRAVRRHLPRTLHRFRSAAAADILVRHLGHADPRVQHKILRGLGRLRADDPALDIPASVLSDEAARALDRAIELLATRIGFYIRAALDGAGDSRSGKLLGELLADAEERALEHVFRVLHISEPRAEFDAIFEALRTPAAAVRAGGLELIEHSVSEALRDALLAMVGPGSDPDRLRGATRSRGSDFARGLAGAIAASGDPLAMPGSEVLRTAVDPVFERLLADGDPIVANVARHRWLELEGAADARGPAQQAHP